MRPKLTIFEGPDGAGKTTAAVTYAKAVDAVYIHFGPRPDLKDNELAREYYRGFEPLIIGRRDTVFDRSWLSEFPYGAVFRDGLYRLEKGVQAELEGIALMFNPLVVFCDPGIEKCLDNYRARKADELLADEDQLRRVYELYIKTKTLLPWTVYNYLVDGGIVDWRNMEKARRSV